MSIPSLWFLKCSLRFGGHRPFWACPLDDYQSVAKSLAANSRRMTRTERENNRKNLPFACACLSNSAKRWPRYLRIKINEGTPSFGQFIVYSPAANQIQGSFMLVISIGEDLEHSKQTVWEMPLCDRLDTCFSLPKNARCWVWTQNVRPFFKTVMFMGQGAPAWMSGLGVKKAADLWPISSASHCFRSAG